MKITCQIIEVWSINSVALFVLGQPSYPNAMGCSVNILQSLAQIKPILSIPYSKKFVPVMISLNDYKEQMQENQISVQYILVKND